VKTIKLLALAIFLLVLANITMANYSLDDSVIVADLDSQITSLKHANIILRSEVASRGSLTQAIETIVAEGYTTPSTIATLAQPDNLALR